MKKLTDLVLNKRNYKHKAVQLTTSIPQELPSVSKLVVGSTNKLVVKTLSVSGFPSMPGHSPFVSSVLSTAAKYIRVNGTPFRST